MFSSVLTGTLGDYVKSEYTLLYLHHGLKSDNKPSLQWLLRVYNMLDK
jgi:Rho GTPase-activating protein 1